MKHTSFSRLLCWLILPLGAFFIVLMAWPDADKTKEPVVHKKPIIAEVPSVPKTPQKDSLSTPRFDDAVRPAPSPGITFAGFPKPLLPDADLSEMTLSQILDQKVDLTNPAARAEKARQLMLVSEARQKAAWARAEKMGLPIRGRNPGGGLFELQDFEDDRPVYHSDETADAAVATAVNELRADPVYAGINGAGVNVGLWDGGQPRRDHRALQHGFLGRRARWMDASRSPISDHATHVAGILAGQIFAISGGGFGAPNRQVAAGMASEAYLLCYNFTQEIAEMYIVAALDALPASNVVSLSNHSYGNETGWHLDGNSRWRWHGAFPSSGGQAAYVEREFGAYGKDAREIDTVCHDFPFFLSFWSAGNQRQDGPQTGALWALPTDTSVTRTYNPATDPKRDGERKIGYDTMGSDKMTKNTLVVGAIEDAVRNAHGDVSPASAEVLGFSSWGPADDGRVKPDIVANGDDVTSAGHVHNFALATMSGTSMATPNATGSAALLTQLYRSHHDGLSPRASLLKALIIHTADDLGNAGPDYQYGWGLMNTKRAADLMVLDAASVAGGRMIEGQLSGETHHFNYVWDGTTPLRATLCWSDPPGVEQTSNDSRARALINDLDLWVTSPSGVTFKPYVMPYVGDWTQEKLSAPATTGRNSVDNVEQVYLPAPLVTGEYVVHVGRTGALSGGSQIYSLIISGHTGPADIALEQPAGTPLTDGTSTIDFGSVDTGKRGTKIFTVRNLGPGSLTVTAVTVDGTNSGDFDGYLPGTTAIPAGESMTIPVTFQPTVAGARNAVLHVVSTARGERGIFDVNLTGNGVLVPTPSPSVQVLHSFNDLNPNGGWEPHGNLVTSDGTTFYGTTYKGGVRGGGVLFSVTISGAYSKILDIGPEVLNGGPYAPLGPTGTLIGSAGSFVVPCNYGGEHSSGGLLGINGNAQTTVASYPRFYSLGDYNHVTEAGGSYFLVEPTGGAGGFGRIHMMNGGTFTTPVTFTGGSGGTPGSSPSPVLVRATDGNMYGVTTSGGSGNKGTFFSLSSGGALTTIMENTTTRFTGSTRLMQAADGHFYGLANTGSNHNLFQLKTGGDYLAFTASVYNTAAVQTPLAQGADGNLYGLVGLHDDKVFRFTLAPAGGPFTSATLTQQLSFGGLPSPQGARALSPMAVGSDGNMYGVTPVGGATNDGCIFRYNTALGTPDIGVSSATGEELANGTGTVRFTPITQGVVTRTIFVHNDARGTLNVGPYALGGAHPGDFSFSGNTQAFIPAAGSATITVNFVPTAPGLRTATLTLPSNDPDESPYVIQLTNAEPEISVQLPAGNELTDDFSVVNFGSAAIGASVTRTFTLENKGTGPLNLTETTKDGAGAASFNVGMLPATLAAGASVTFTVTFTPSAAGFSVAGLHIGTDDLDEAPFDLILAGSGAEPVVPKPQIAVEYPAGTDLTNGLDTVVFGGSTVGVQVFRTLTIRNDGDAELTLGSITIDGDNAADFQASSPASSTLAPAASTTFNVGFTLPSIGARTAQLHIASNDTEDSPFDIDLVGTSAAATPEIVVGQPQGPETPDAELLDGGPAVSFGDVSTGYPQSLVFNIRNTGLADLSLDSASIDGANAADFVLSPPALTLLPPGAGTSLIVTFTPGAVGGRTAMLHLDNNDTDEDPFDVALSGTGTSPSPEIDVRDPVGAVLADGTPTVNLTPVQIATTGLAQAFTLHNVGTAPLTGMAITKSGTDSMDFTVGALTVTSLAAGDSTPFTVTFSPTTEGTKTANLHIASNDSNETSFDLTLQAVAYPEGPQFAVQPASQMIIVGQTALFEPVITGVNPRQHQWRKGTTNIASATGSTYSIASLKSSDLGIYSQRVTNANGEATSANAYLGVVTRGPLTTAVIEGTILNLSCTATAPAGVTLGYVWRRNEVPLVTGGRISGASTKALKITGMTPDDEGIYTCRITMTTPAGPGTGTNGDTVVTVTRKPVLNAITLADSFVSQPVDQTITAINSPTKYAATELPPGVILNITSGLLSGKPTAPKITAGNVVPYIVKFTTSNAAGSSATVSVEWLIQPMPIDIPGVYEALIGRETNLNNQLGGAISFTIATTGKLTGTVKMAGKTYPLTGAVSTGPLVNSVPTINVSVTRTKPLPALLLNLSLGVDRDISGTISDSTHTTTVTGWRCPFNATSKTTLIGVHNFGLIHEAGAPGASATVPFGDSIAIATIAAAGTVNWSGFMADGTSFTASHLLGTNGRALMHAMLSTTVGSVQGSAVIQALPLTDSGIFTWRKNASTAVSYKNGFGPLTLTAYGAQYIKPGTNVILLGLPPTQANARIYFYDGGLAADFLLPVTIPTNNIAVMPLPQETQNPFNVKLTLTPATGRLTGTFTLKNTALIPPPGTLTRTPTFNGLIIPAPGMNQGFGHFNLAELPDATGEKLTTTPLRSGRVRLSAP